MTVRPWILPLFLLLSNAPGSDIRLAGKVVCGHSALPLDSVRVASLSTRTAVFSDTLGNFSLSIGTRQEHPDPRSMYEYILKCIASGAQASFVSRAIDPVLATLYDLTGRRIARTEYGGSIMRFPAQMPPAGAYVLHVTGFQPVRIIATGHPGFGAVHQRQLATIVPLAPDTIVFCKDGFRPSRVALSALNDGCRVRMSPKRWVASDIHNHTVLTDGSFIQDSLLVHAFGKGGLDVYANSEHGGMSWVDTAGNTIEGDHVPRGYDGVVVPRWYTLQHYSWPKLLGQRVRYPGKVLLQGIEWNCPGHEHSSVGIIGDGYQPEAIARFEYQFDEWDYDTSISWLPKANEPLHANTVIALQWLQANYPGTGYFFLNHPTRAHAGMYPIEDIRDFHAAAPSVFLGLEGMPGHQKNAIRGGYSCSSFESQTFGGADCMLATIGGVWDALLGEGRRLWIIANSDFHHTGNDFWPGEYTKTWTTVTDTGGLAWLEGIRGGETFVVTGDLVSGLSFSIDDGVFNAPMGSVLSSRSREVTVIVRCMETPLNNHGDANRIDHVDLISGAITGMVNALDTGAYRDPTNATTACVRRFFASDGTRENEWLVFRERIVCTQPAYFRLRGTSLSVAAPGEVDVDGNPLPDAIGTNSAEVAWKDLWFYSNPIFVYPFR